MKKILIIILILAVLGVGGYFGYKHFKGNDKPINNKKVYTDSIKGYDYKLEKRDSKLYKEKFGELKKVLESKDLDYEKYATLLAQMYIIDLYTLDNKVNTYDVGGSEFIYPDALENYELKVKDTIYRYMEDNSYGKRKQKLPSVKSIKVETKKETTFELKGEDDNDVKKLDGFQVDLSWTYEKDYGYDEEATVILVKNEDKKMVYVIEQKTGDEEEEDD